MNFWQILVPNLFVKQKHKYCCKNQPFIEHFFGNIQKSQQAASHEIGWTSIINIFNDKKTKRIEDMQ